MQWSLTLGEFGKHKSYAIFGNALRAAAEGRRRRVRY